MSSDNPTGAENQQERLKNLGWVVGFVDGEGCFSVPIYRCKVMTLRWQVRPEFAVTQGASSRSGAVSEKEGRRELRSPPVGPAGEADATDNWTWSRVTDSGLCCAAGTGVE